MYITSIRSPRHGFFGNSEPFGCCDWARLQEQIHAGIGPKDFLKTLSISFSMLHPSKETPAAPASAVDTAVMQPEAPPPVLHQSDTDAGAGVAGAEAATGASEAPPVASTEQEQYTRETQKPSIGRRAGFLRVVADLQGSDPRFACPSRVSHTCFS